MKRWARWQVVAFAASMATMYVVIAVLIRIELADPGRNYVFLQVILGGFVGLTGWLYVTRSRALRSLAKTTERYRILMEEASDPIFVSELRSRRFVDVNRRAVLLTGYSRAELTSMTVPELVDQGNIDMEEVRRQIAGGAVLHLEQKIVRKDGVEIPIEVSVNQVAPDLVQAIVRPIEERKLAEDALRRSESVFRAVSEMTSDYVFSMKVHMDGSLTPEWLTGAYERVTGYTIEEARAGGGWETLVHPEDLPRLSRVLAEALEAGGLAESEFRIVTKQGEIRHLRSWSRFERDDPEGPVVRIVGAVSDITAEKMLEQNLGETERRFKELYERLPIGIYRRAWDGHGLDVNPTCVEMFGYPDDKTYLEQDPINLYANPRDHERWVSIIEEFGVVVNFEVEYKRYDGSTFWGRNTARLVRDDHGNAWVEGAVVDITEEKNLDEELRTTLRDLRRAYAQRRSLLTHLVKAKEEERRRVASDIHDDSVQVMTSIAIDLERLARKADDPAVGDFLAELEGRVRDAVGRLRTMVFELRPPTLDQEGVASALRLYLEEFTIDTGIEHEFGSALDREPARPTRVVLYRIAQEALTNVRKHSGASRVVVKLRPADSGIAMTVSDDGVGFDPSSEDVISPGHIGLSEMRERAEISGGRFSIQSEPGRGATVDVWVPELEA